MSKNGGWGKRTEREQKSGKRRKFEDGNKRPIIALAREGELYQGEIRKRL